MENQINNNICGEEAGVSGDVGKEKQQELELKRAKEAAEAANKAKIEFIANMSHDIRTPLSGVIGMADLLAQALTDPQHKQYAQWINESGEQLLHLLNGILESASVDNINEQDIHKEFFDLQQCIKDIIAIETPAAHLKNLELKSHWDEQIPTCVYSDRIKIHRILLNLVGNAIKFTEQGSIFITVRLVGKEERQVSLQFSVSDTGIGIFPEQQNKVFDRFHKISPSHKGIYSGFGVGLHIVLAYVKLLGGTINLKSAPGEGTTFDFCLSFEYLNKESIEAAPDVYSEDCDGKVTESFSHGQYQILIVEDNAIALKVAESIVSKAGCHVQCASTGEEALSIIHTYPFDLIITDIGLPGMSGYELTEAIRTWEKVNNKKSTPIVGLTAHVISHTEKSGLNAGMNEVYSKPITDDLLNTILNKNVMKKAVAVEERKNVYGRLGFDLPNTEEELFELKQFALLDINKAITTIGNKHLVHQVLELMISEEIENDINSIIIAHSEGNWDEIEGFAHKMKGGALYIGTVRMQYACQYLERYHKAGHTRLLEALYQQLITVVHDTQNYIRQWLNS